MALSCDQFSDFMTRIIEEEDRFNAFAESVEKYYNGSSLMCSEGSELPIEILRAVMNDEGEWITYWLYELNRGEYWKPGMITDDETNEDVPLRTLEDLYNVLTRD